MLKRNCLYAGILATFCLAVFFGLRPTNGYVSTQDIGAVKLNKKNVRSRYEPKKGGQTKEVAVSKENRSLTPSSARDFFERFKSQNPSVNDRAIEAARLVNLLCTNGYRKEAWQFVESTPGLVRNHQLDAFFSNSAGDITKRVEKVGMLSSAVEKKEAGNKIISSLPNEELVSASLNSLIKKYPVIKEGYIEALKFRLEHMDRSKKEVGISAEIIQNATDLLMQGDFSVLQYGELLNNDFSKTPFERMNAFESLGFEKLPKGYVVVQSSIIRQMVSEDPKAAVGHCLNNLKHSKPEAVTSAIDSWARSDWDGLRKWVQKDVDALDVRSKDLVMYGLAQTAMNFGEIETAKSYQGLISNAELSEKTHARIENQRKMEPKK